MKLGFIKIKNSYISKNIIRKAKKPFEWEKIFANHISKGLVIIIYKTYNSTIKRQTIQFKNRQSFRIETFLKKIYRWLICTQHH